jgi:hypothetical protein
MYCAHIDQTHSTAHSGRGQHRTQPRQQGNTAVKPRQDPSRATREACLELRGRVVLLHVRRDVLRHLRAREQEETKLSHTAERREDRGAFAMTYHLRHDVLLHAGVHAHRWVTCTTRGRESAHEK